MTPEGDFGCYEIRDEQKRYFCKACGTTLYWTGSFRPGQTGIAAGCFQHGTLDQPVVSAQNAFRCEWVNLPERMRLFG